MPSEAEQEAVAGMTVVTAGTSAVERQWAHRLSVSSPTMKRCSSRSFRDVLDEPKVLQLRQ